jgi:SAM-dependent methyltransferase
MTSLLRPRKVRIPDSDRAKIEVEPYSALARYYDQVMDHVDYVGWAAYIHRIAKKHGRRPGRAVDFACGTGSLLRELNVHGYHGVGLDASSEMITVANALKPVRGASLEFHVSEMTKIPPAEDFEIGVCLYDSVNYLMAEESVRCFLRNVRDTLRTGGMFILDLSTEKNSRDHFDGYSIEEEIDGALYRRWTRYDPVERVQHNYFDILPDHEPVIYHEHHQQRVWGVDWMSGQMKDCDFHLIAVYHNLTVRPGGEKSDRVHIVAEPA